MLFTVIVANNVAQVKSVYIFLEVILYQTCPVSI